MDLLSQVRTVQDFPSPGINFFDVTSILEKPMVFSYTIKQMQTIAAQNEIESIVAIDARGFIWASALADRLKCPLYLARKPGKLPGEVATKEYKTEYSTASLSMIKSHNIQGPVLVIDDILATGGTMNAVGSLLSEHWNIEPKNQIHCVLIELGFLPGRQVLEAAGYSVQSLVTA
jgi:adenine phosphoribosyltransferase